MDKVSLQAVMQRVFFYRLARRIDGVVNFARIEQVSNIPHIFMGFFLAVYFFCPEQLVERDLEIYRKVR